jgi:hypothetical protein
MCICLPGAKQASEMKQQEKVILEREVQELLSSNFNSRKFQEVVKKFSDLNSESVQQGLAK